MDRSFLRSTPLMAAIPAATLAALAYFFFAPTPPEKLLLNPGASPNPVPPPRWTEWRTPEFYEMRAALDRADPSRIVHEVFEGFRDAEFGRVLALSSKRLQERNSPERLRRRFAFEPGFTGWDEILIDSIDAQDDRVTIDGRSVGAEATFYYRAALIIEDGGWVFDYLRIAPNEEDRDENGPRPPDPPTTEPMVTPRHPAAPAS